MASEKAPLVGIIMGSDSDLAPMEKAGEVLNELGPDEYRVWLAEYNAQQALKQQ